MNAEYAALLQERRALNAALVQMEAERAATLRRREVADAAYAAALKRLATTT